MDKAEILRKVIAKLAKTMSTQDVLNVIFEITGKEDVSSPNYAETVKIDSEQHKSLRDLYDHAPVKKLYTYSLGKFGFEIDELRVDVEPAFLKVKKLK